MKLSDLIRMIERTQARSDGHALPMRLELTPQGFLRPVVGKP